LHDCSRSLFQHSKVSSRPYYYYNMHQAMTGVETSPALTDSVVLVIGEENQGSSSPGGCNRVRAEWSLSFFDSKDVNGKTLDLGASFSYTNPSWFVLAGKVAVWTVAFADLVESWKNSVPSFYLAYLSHWGLLLSVIYLTLSLTMSLAKPLQQKLVVYTTWQLFSLSVNFEIIITILFWLLDYDPDRHDLNFTTLTTHGVCLVCVMLDGHLLNRTPVRLKHGIVTMAMAAIYVGWTVIHTYVIEDNPTKTDSDLLYDVVDWKDSFESTIILCVIIVFAVAPLLHLMIFSISLFGRRYEQEMDKVLELPSMSSNDTPDEEEVPPAALQSIEVLL
jgi:hypothetical protein